MARIKVYNKENDVIHLLNVDLLFKYYSYFNTFYNWTKQHNINWEGI